MFETGDNAAEPDHGDLVWRYMDLGRFVSLLDQSAVFFAQAARMVDKWEGSLGSFSIPMSDETRRQTQLANQQTTYLSCWHASENESAAMWDIYQREGRGIAIQTTWGDLISSITSAWPISGGLVQYVDPSEIAILHSTLQSPFMLKRKSFEHEREARLVLWGNGCGGPDERRGIVPGIEGEIFYSDASTGRPGHYVGFDLNRLVNRVYVSPASPGWVEQTIVRLVQRFGYEFQVVKSDLYSDPFLR
ncbi:DUF2971 domain-containing protein [Arthrobacter cryoconiti]|uniref:DUF2971 domain-containing protein n=1 Tax=Arthrobacter cryoconiti TaxID=748907 RepID=A0ABV8R0E5_9MICC|nr:DUF2971 domain-containing protein [Arthrobacter cryoconiti]MCC9068671.1 DUF2971 domain-containing protein [Arthrobacter cryoconiti]